MRPLTAAEVAGLFRKMRAYRLLFWIYAVSAMLYLFAVLGLPPQPQTLHLPLADLALGYGVLCALAVFLGKWLALRPSALRARGLETLSAASTHIFLTLAFLLAAGESMGMVALTAATLGAGPPWKLAMLCLWQLALSVLLTPDRDQWDRVLTRWESTLLSGEENEAH